MTTKRFVALARVSSREQEREGFSLDVQVDALKRYAAAVPAGGSIVKLYRIAETASKTDERKTFRALIDYVRANADQLDGLLFYKVDRAARNLHDYVELERLESEFGVPFISVSQPTDNNPAGRMMRRMLANMASFYTEQQSVDVREGLAKRAQRDGSSASRHTVTATSVATAAASSNLIRLTLPMSAAFSSSSRPGISPSTVSSLNSTPKVFPSDLVTSSSPEIPCAKSSAIAPTAAW